MKAATLAAVVGLLTFGGIAAAAEPAGPAVEPKPLTVAEVRAKHWSFQPVKKAEPPTVQNKAWVKTPVDAFVLARMEAKGHKPAPPADKRTLIRRATFDLTGLPPTP